MALTKVTLIQDGVITADHLHANHGITTDNIGEGTNKFYTDARVASYLSANNYQTSAAGYFTGVTHDTVGQTLTFSKSNATTEVVSLAQYIDDTNLARLTSGTVDAATGIATFTRDDATTFTVDFSSLLDDTDDYVNSASFNALDGVLTLNRLGGGTVTVDLDGRYLTSETDSQTLSWVDATNTLSISNGNSVTLTGFADASHNHDDRYYTETESDARYLQSYSETDTLASVTARGSSTTGNITVNGNIYMTGTLLQFANNDGFFYNDSTNTMYVRTDGSDSIIITSSNIGSQSVSYASNAGTLDNIDSTAFTQSGDAGDGDLNSSYWEGASRLTSSSITANGPGTGWYTVYNNRHRGGTGDGTSYGSQIVIGMTTNYDNMYFRSNRSNNVWTSWHKLWHDGNDGSGTGLDADLLDGQHASAFQPAGSYASSSHNHNGTYAYYDHIRSLGSTAFTTTNTTAGLITEMENDGAFDSYTSVFKTTWSYAGNFNLTDAGRFTETAGSSWITWTDNSSDSARGNITALVIAPNTGGSAGRVFIYNDQGSSYDPGWREVWTSRSDGAGSGLDADLLDGYEWMTSGKSVRGDSVYVGSGGGYFYNDSGSRVRINQDFYTNNGNTYLYANSLYLGNSSGDNIYVRGNYISANNWNIQTSGQARFTSYYDWNDTNYYIDPNNGGTAFNVYGKRYNFGTSRDWDGVGFGNVTNLHPQGHNQFWFGAGNGTWFTGTANSKTQASGLASDASYAHDLLISTMQSTSTYDRGITFAVDNTGAGNSGWRLGKWHSGDAADSSKLVVDGGLFVKGAYTDEYDYYADDYSAYYSSQSAPAFWSGGTNVPSITASTAIMIQSGNKGTSTRNPQLQFHQYGYGGVQFRYDGPNDRMYLEPLGTNRFDWYRNQTDHGYIDFGPANTSHAHIYTDRANFYFNKQLTVSGGSQVNSGDVRASIFYDIDNTGYYANPASTSVFNDFRCDIMYDKDNTSYYVRPGSTSILNDARANIWYSRSNTGYYTDPEATSNINSLTTKGNVTFDLGTNSLYVKAVAGYGAYARFQDANTGTNQWNTGSYGNLMFTRYNTSVKEKKASSYKVWDYSSTNNGYLFSSTYTMKSVNRNYPALCLSSTYYASQQFIAFHNFTSGYKIGRISFNGTANVTYSTSGSDERLKENIVDWNENVSDKFETIQPKTFTFIHDVEEKQQKGFIAQNEYDKFPEAYPIDTEGFHEFNPSGMVVYLMKALQEQIKKTKELEQRLTDAGL